ncbi:unnamed protein product [Peronospora destructor]|uniref:START domain-containing protein n=1 Tax=Peronospora destructor TaxID=86335 RepID=A0AAV0VDB6_9STRA|nr:unnamed protein product [Peronospora destructor]
MKGRFIVNPFRELSLISNDQGKLEDLLFGVISEDLETMRVKASYVSDISGAAVLDSVVLPTLEEPFQSLAIKWMELDIPLSSTNLVKNRDYVYLEGTGYVINSKGERMGYHLLHSVDFPQAHRLPNRVRGNLSIIGFWRQIGNNTMEMYATGVMDPGDAGLVRKLVVPTMANVFLSALRLGDFGKSNSTCKICFGFVCHACKIVRKLSFVDPDLLLSQRRVTFRTVCISSATSMSSIDCAHARILKHGTVGRSSALQKSSFEDDSEE